MPQGVRGLKTPPYNNSALLLTFGTSRRRSGCAVQPDITKVSSRKPYLSFFCDFPPYLDALVGAKQPNETPLPYMMGYYWMLRPYDGIWDEQGVGQVAQFNLTSRKSAHANPTFRFFYEFPPCFDALVGAKQLLRR
jgi:hypothetical protein